MSPDGPTPGPDGERDGDMGVSSERVGPTGPGQVASTGERDVSPADRDPEADTPPEQARGGAESNPDGVPPKAEPPHLNPRDDA